MKFGNNKEGQWIKRRFRNNDERGFIRINFNTIQPKIAICINTSFIQFFFLYKFLLISFFNYPKQLISSEHSFKYIIKLFNNMSNDIKQKIKKYPPMPNNLEEVIKEIEEYDMDPLKLIIRNINLLLKKNIYDSNKLKLIWENISRF